MLNFIFLLQGAEIAASEASKPLLEYGIVGAILFIAIVALGILYTTQNKREKERHELFRQDMQAVAAANRAERERWQKTDDIRFDALQELTKSHIEVSVKNTAALEKLCMLIQERIK